MCLCVLHMNVETSKNSYVISYVLHTFYMEEFSMSQEDIKLNAMEMGYLISKAIRDRVKNEGMINEY